MADNAYQDSGASPPVTPIVDVSEAVAPEVALGKKEPQSARTPNTSKQPPKGATELTESDSAAFERLRIGAELLAQAHVQRVTDGEAREKYGITGPATSDLSGIVFPYFSPTTDKRVTARVRRDHPEIENGKPKNKYLSAYGDRRHLYFVPGCAEYVKDADVPVVLVEAEKSALALTAWTRRTGHRILPVGMGGCNGWRGRIGKQDGADGSRLDEKGPLPELAVCSSREVYVMLDSNASSNPHVRQARAALVRTLCGYSARVRIATVPVIEGVNGPDDLLAVAGDSAIQQVLETAQPALDVAVADAEAAIEAVRKANAESKVAQTVRAMDAVADVSDDLRREFLVARLAAATRGSFSKKTITEGIAERRRESEQKKPTAPSEWNTRRRGQSTEPKSPKRLRGSSGGTLSLTKRTSQSSQSGPCTRTSLKPSITPPT